MYCKERGKIMSETLDVIIIGGGPAGLTAALYTSRARLNTLVLEKTKIGGQITLTHEIANYPGAIMGSDEEPSGVELTARMKEQAEKFGAKFELQKEVVKVDFDGDIKYLETQDGEKYQAKSIIIATGATPREIGCPGEQELKSKGVSYCATCDGPFFEELEVVVVGGGNSAVEEAIFLTSFATKVTIVQNLDHLTAEAIVIEQAKNNDKIDYIFNSVVESIEGDGMVEAMTIRDTKTDIVTKLNASEEDGTFGIFVFIGYNPQTDLFKGVVDLNEYGYIITDESMKTSKDGIFAAGDLRPKQLRQVITAAGDGATAAFAVQKYLESKK